MLWVMLAKSSGLLDFLTNAACRRSARRGLGSVEPLVRGRGVGWHADEPDVGMRLLTEGQELQTDVHGTHVHEADPVALLPSGFTRPCEEGCEGRRRRPAALRMRGGQQRWVGVGGFHGEGLALQNELDTSGTRCLVAT